MENFQLSVPFFGYVSKSMPLLQKRSQNFSDSCLGPAHMQLIKVFWEIESELELYKNSNSLSGIHILQKRNEL